MAKNTIPSPPSPKKSSRKAPPGTTKDIADELADIGRAALRVGSASEETREIADELLELADGDPLAAAGVALAEAEIAKSPAEMQRWQAAAIRLEALDDLARKLPYVSGGPAGVRVQQASALAEEIVSHETAERIARENAALEARRKAETEARLAAIAATKERMAALPIEFQRRLGLMSRIDWHAAAGNTNSGRAVPGGGPGLAEAELVVCELAVKIARTCESVVRVNALVEATRGVPPDMRREIVGEYIGVDMCAAWSVENVNLFAKACRLAAAWLGNPESVLLVDNPGRVGHAVAARVADKAIASFGTLPTALAAATDDTGSIAGRLAPVEGEAVPQLGAVDAEVTTAPATEAAKADR